MRAGAYFLVPDRAFPAADPDAARPFEADFGFATDVVRAVRFSETRVTTRPFDAGADFETLLVVFAADFAGLAADFLDVLVWVVLEVFDFDWGEIALRIDFRDGNFSAPPRWPD